MTNKQAYAGLLERLGGQWFDPAAGARVLINPDGPEAAEAISSLLKRVGELEGLLRTHGQHEPFCRTYQERVGGNCICELAFLNSDAPLSIGEEQ